MDTSLGHNLCVNFKLFDDRVEAVFRNMDYDLNIKVIAEKVAGEVKAGSIVSAEVFDVKKSKKSNRSFTIICDVLEVKECMQ